MPMNGAELRHRREVLQLTQSEVADRMSITTATLRNWEGEAEQIPPRAEMLWGAWERRFQQESPHLGTVTLIYTDGPMFIDPQGPQRPLAMMRQEPFITNASAVARACSLWGREGFESPIVLLPSGAILWSAIELKRVVEGFDDHAPVIPNMARSLASDVRTYSSRYVRHGPRLPTPEEVVERQRLIEAQADNLDQLAQMDTPTSTNAQPYELIHNRLNELSIYPRGDMVSAIHHAYQSRNMRWPNPQRA
jgi:hypothetical protein